MNDSAGLFDPAEPHLLIQLHGNCKIGVGLQVQMPVPGRTGPVLRSRRQFFSIALPLGGIIQIQLLQFRAVPDSVKLRNTGAADDLPISSSPTKYALRSGLRL